jgi:hypothetical protein
LKNRLVEAGWDERETRRILFEEADHATNPKERRSEIDRLLSDDAVRLAA